MTKEVQTEWNKTDNRFVIFFDVLGFKDLVQTRSHEDILEKLTKLKNDVEQLEDYVFNEGQKQKVKQDISKCQVKSVTFSDSFIFFSKKDTVEDFTKILVDAWVFLKRAIESKIAVKGAISFGQVTVDFDKNLFFGQPIIDAYLLHEDLNMLGVIMDHKVDTQIKNFIPNVLMENNIGFEKINMKYGPVKHSFISPLKEEAIRGILSDLHSMYSITSGKPRIYIDNTIGFYETILKEQNKGLTKNQDENG
jgi:hypothetical protein